MNPNTTEVVISPYLACPLCKGPLEVTGMQQVRCTHCHAAYAIEDGIPILLPPHLEQFKAIEAEFHSSNAEDFAQRHGMCSYRVDRYTEDYLMELRTLPPGSVLLEVGGGEGIEATRLREIGLIVIESDIAKGMVKRARQRAQVNCQMAHSVFVVCDAEQLPVPDGSMDAVMIVAALHHLQSSENFVIAAGRALKPGGLLVIGFEPNRWPYFTLFPALCLLSALLHPWRSKPVEGTRSIADEKTTGFVPTDFIKYLKMAGLVQVRLRRIWYVSGFVHTVLSILNNRRSTEHLLELPVSLQRWLVRLDDFLAYVPLVRELCWHWSVIARRP